MQERRFGLLSVGILVVVSLIYWLYYDKLLYADDWFHLVTKHHYDGLPLIDWPNRRPLLYLFPGVLTSLFGSRIGLFYGFSWLWQVVLAVLFQRLLYRTTDDRFFSVFAAVLWLLYPANITHTWITVGLVIAPTLVLVFLFAHGMIVWSETGNRWTGWLANIALLVSFLVYESQFGAAVLWTIFIYVTQKRRPRNLALLTPLLLCALFAIWRVFGLDLLGVDDRHLDNMVVDLGTLGTRWLMGAGVLVWSWIKVLGTRFPGLGRTTLIAAFVGASVGYVIALAVASHWLSPRRRVALRDRGVTERIGRAAVASLFALAGFVPIILVFSPSIGSLSSRTTLVASFGASAVVAALVQAVVRTLATDCAKWATAALVVPLVFIGAVAQTDAQRENRLVWQVEKRAFQVMFDEYPNLRDGTTVVFLLAEHSTSRMPFRYVSEALPFLYGKPRGALSSDVKVLPLTASDLTWSPDEVVLVYISAESLPEILMPEDLGRIDLRADGAWSGYDPSDRRDARPIGTDALAARRFVLPD